MDRFSVENPEIKKVAYPRLIQRLHYAVYWCMKDAPVSQLSMESLGRCHL